MPPNTQEQAKIAARLISQMSLEEKLGQLTLAENNSISPAQARDYKIGAVLSGGGGNPTPNSPASWRDMVCAYQEAALETRLGIPLLYGSDAVHGHNNLRGAVIFPHNIGLGAARDADLVERIGNATARELLGTSAHWTFAPSVSVPQDLRWGRSYEGYSEDPALVAELGAALVRGLQAGGAAACAKHFIADGAAAWRGTKPEAGAATQGSTAPPQAETPPLDASLGQWQIDQGDAAIDEAALRRQHLPPYQAAVAAGVLTVMASYSSWNGQKLHGHRYLLTDLLKGELGFNGFVVTDWMAIDQLDADYSQCVVQAINAGIDMVMVPYDFARFLRALREAVETGAIPTARLDDAVRRILTVKAALGLFDAPYGAPELLPSIGAPQRRALAREAAGKSCTLLVNRGGLLPLPRALPRLFVAGRAADDIGLQCGGWTISWQGQAGATTSGTTLLQGIHAAVSADTPVEYAPDGRFPGTARAPVGIVTLHEEPYAEGFGDRADLALSAEEIALLQRARARCDQLIVLLISGRPRIITRQLPLMDALIAAWLPGSEGAGIADVLFGAQPFGGRLPYRWPRSMAQITDKTADPLWQYGYGLKT